MNTEIETTPTTVPVPIAPLGIIAEKAPARSRILLLASVTTVLVAGLAAGLLPRLRAQAQREVEARQPSLQTVAVTNASRAQAGLQLTLPGDVRAFEQTRIYARADGYLRRWTADIGTKVEAGQVLAEIDSPELDQELSKARATVSQARA